MRINAAAPQRKRIHLYGGAGSLTIQALAAEATTPPTFEMLAYSGGLLTLDNFNYPVVLDLQGLAVPSQHRPIFRDHRRWKLIAHTTNILNDGKVLKATGVVSGTGPDAKEILHTARNGFQWQASIGAVSEQVEFVAAGSQVQVNGQTFDGPVYVSRKSRLDEISFVPLGADSIDAGGRATVSIAAQGDSAMTFEQWCLGFMTIEEFQALSEDGKSALQMAFDATQGGESEGEGDPAADALPAIPNAAAAVPVPASAPTKKTRRRIQGTQRVVTDGNALRDQLRIEAAAEVARQTGIRRLCAQSPDLETDLGPDGNPLTDERGRPMKVNIMAHAIAQNWSAQQTELVVLRAGRNVGSPFGYVSSGKPSATPQVIEAALCKTLLLPVEKYFKPEILEAADAHFKRGCGLQRVILMAAAQNGYHPGPGERISSGNIRSVLQAAFHPKIEAGWTPISLPGIFSNTANKEILQGYMEEDLTWKEISQVKSVPDFKQMKHYRLLDNMEYEELNPDGTIKHGLLDEENWTSQAKTYAKMLALTREQIINDDLGAFDAIKAILGRGSALKMNTVFWTAFLASHSTFFTTARTNYITGATTTLLRDGVGLALGVKAFRQMKTPGKAATTDGGPTTDGGKRLGGKPEILLIPPELEVEADILFTGANLSTTSAVLGDNPYQGKYRPVVSAWLSDSAFTGYSTTAWYLLRSPSLAPMMVVSFLDGMQTPTVEDAEADFNTLGVQFRGYHDFGCDQAEYLCGVKSKGAA